MAQNTIDKTETTETEVATEALQLQKQIDDLNEKLASKKDLIREYAAGDKKTITIEGLGKVTVSKPREATDKLVTILDEARLENVPDLKQKLIDKGIIKEEIKSSPGAKASVSIKPNV